MPIGDKSSDDDRPGDGDGEGETVSSILVGELRIVVDMPLLLAIPAWLFLFDTMAAAMATLMAKNRMIKRHRMMSPLWVDVSRLKPIFSLS